MLENKYIYNIEGYEQLSYSSIESILSQYNNTIDKIELNKIFKKKLFTIVVECLENIQKHAVFIGKAESGPKSYFFNITTKNDEEYVITAGNLIYNYNINPLKKKLNLINQLNFSHLKELYKRTLKKTSISEKGGADLGLIDIAIKSNSKLNYFFDPVDKEMSLYKIQITLVSK